MIHACVISAVDADFFKLKLSSTENSSNGKLNIPLGQIPFDQNSKRDYNEEDFAKYIFENQLYFVALSSQGFVLTFEEIIFW